MSLMSQLYDTYERNAGLQMQDGSGMTPIAHMDANAQVEITISENGDFLAAAIIPKSDAVTLIPVSESSAGRSSGIAPHALCDTLPYIAGDFSDYYIVYDKSGKVDHKRTDKDVNLADNKFKKYLAGLKKWSEYSSNRKIHAIYNYISKKKIISDLIKAGVIKLDVNGKYAKDKISGYSYDKALTRFRVLITGESESAVWKDSEIVEEYINYYLANQNGLKDICYLTGEESVISENHPKGILASNYGAKLISANDNQGFTFRGRFLNAEQSYALSYKASQEVHSALTWLIKHQGAYVGTQDKRMFVCWNPSGKKTPPIVDPLFPNDEMEVPDTDISYKEKLIKTFQGYKDSFVETDSILVVALDAATTGRLSVTYYQELLSGQFFNNIQKWFESYIWFRPFIKDKEYRGITVDAPDFKSIITCAYGRQRDKFIEVDDKVLKEQTQRLVKSMIEGQSVPRDLVITLVNRASTPLAYSYWNRERVLYVACAIIYGYHRCQEKKGDYSNLKLDGENRNRSYLFGRLLAVLDRVERATFHDEQRETNAVRLQAAYVNHPMQTWRILEDILIPYYQKLKPGSREYYRSLISEIMTLFKDEDKSVMNRPLKEEYLLGFYLQRAALRSKSKESKEEALN